MRRREDLKITKHTLNLFEGDYAKLQNLYGSRVGGAKIVRDLVHAHIRKIEATAAQTQVPLGPLGGLDVELKDVELEEAAHE
jgi:hypothetical protein